MGTFIHLNESKLMDYYEKMMDDIYLQYFTFPSDFPYLPISDADRADMSYYEAMGRGHAQAAGLEGETTARFSPSPRVNHHSDPKYCNGLPRRSR